MSRATLNVALALLIAACCWPWISGLALWPMAPDSGTWIARSRLGVDDWAEWVFATRHFNVGWRPLTALTFTLNHMLGGLEPFVYRATDLALHAAAIALVFAVFRRLFPSHPPWAGLLAAGLFGLHPVTAEVVPFIARRSYALSTALGLGGLVLFHASLSGKRGAALGAGLLIAAACFANEASVLYAGVLPFLAWFAAPQAGGGAERKIARAVRRCVVPAVPVTLALALRIVVVGGIGGYRLPESAAERALPIFLSTWRGVAAIPEGSSFLPTVTILVVAAPFYVWSTVRGPGLRLVLLLWLLAYALLYAGQGVWFPRQAYVVAVPFALLVADVLASTARPEQLVPQALLIGAVLWTSPTLRGPDPARMAEWTSRDRLISRMYADLAACEEPATVQLVLHYFKPPARPDALRAQQAEQELPRLAHQPRRWLATLLEDRDIDLIELAFYEMSGGPEPPPVDLEATPPTVTLPQEVLCFVRAGGGMPPLDAGADRTIRIPPPPEGRNGYVYSGSLERGRLQATVTRRAPPAGPGGE